MTPLAWLALAGLWLAAVYFFYRHRIWLPFYVTGAVGLALLLIGTGRSVFPLEATLARHSAYHVHELARWLGVQTRIFTEAPGVILVLVVPQSQGWTMIEIGIECSGLLEEAVLIGLLAFFPGWSLRRRLGMLSVGVVATYLGNLVRILFIILTLHYWGKDSLFLAHTLVGRVIFFLIVIVIYWLMVTHPTLVSIRTKLLARQAL